MIRVLALWFMTAAPLLVGSAPTPRQKPSPAPRSASPAEIAPQPAALDAGAPAPPAPKKEARVIPLDETQARTFHTIITHPSIPAILEFPEPFLGTPSCGDCVDGSSPPEVLRTVDALFLFDLFPAEQYISIKPAQYSKRDGGRVPDENFLTTLTIRLQSKVTLTLRIQYGTVDQADARVVFTLPQRSSESQYIREQTAKLKQELEASFVDRVADAAKKDLVRLFLEPHNCAPTSRRERNDNIIVEVKEICRFGQKGLIRFTIENRHKASFNIGSVQVQVGKGQEAAPVENLVHVFDSDASEVPFRATVAGAVAFDVPEDGKHYEFTVLENGGKNRKVLLTELGF